MSQQIRIGVAGIYHETNSFAPGVTTLNDFKQTWIDKSEVYFNKYQGTRTSMGGTIDSAKVNDIDLLPGLYTETTPSGMVTEDTIGSLIDSLVESISDRIDGLILILHGAMVSESYPDVEAEIVNRVRKKVGISLPIVVTLDLHANTSEALIKHTNCIVGYDTYPHVDAYERAIEATDILIQMIKGKIKPIMAWESSRMLVPPQTMMTNKTPMKTLMQYASELEKNPKILNVTVAGGFPFSDILDAGMSFIVTTDGDENLAKKSVKELSQLAWELREKFTFEEVSLQQAYDWTIQQNERPIIWVEGSDNVGGGSPADATHVLSFLVESDQKSLMIVRDSEVALKAHILGVGENLHCKLGGKSDGLHGEPVEIKGLIRLLSDGKFKHKGPYMAGKEGDMGRTAVVDANNMTIVITENRIPPFDINHVKSIGIDPEAYQIIVVKAAIAWKTSFGDISKGEVYLDTPGCCSANLQYFNYNNIKRPIYPLDPM
ncbi:M81 family metallopeptidase [Ornithinibacillus sp. 4-3]|uniref:M81 family metallopeptidase n=1 Tax=Ornithinibacillus sp. 4-3 TaxID=3231488 RepID=A0AB39HLI2_9BACI